VSRQPGELESSPIGYRPALDGLRALAVLGVISYHLDYRWARGGFLGVDLFFVLSGYLITSLLVDERLRTGRTDFLGFWVRRIRRLIPALLLLLVVMAVATRLLLPPTDWAARQADLFWALFYAANWHQIAAEQDYFAQFQITSFLRHLWSLGIEEQFYLAWPVLIALLIWGRRLQARVPILVGLGAVASAVTMWQLLASGSPLRAYYGTDARAHELLVGALLAILIRWSGRLGAPRPRLAQWLGPAALAAVLLAFALVSDTSARYYEGGSLLFSLGVAAMLWTVELHPAQPLAWVLGRAVPRWLGQVSYGLYLWHWPAIVLGPRLAQQLLGPGANWLLSSSTRLNALRVGLALTATVASYYLIERPIRQGRASQALTNLRVSLALPSLALLTCLFFLSLGLAPLTTVVQAQDQAQGLDPSGCPVKDAACIVTHPGPPGSPVVALMGDSIAMSLDPAFTELARQRHWTYLMAAHNYCSVIEHWIPVVRDGKASRLPEWARCYGLVPGVQHRVLAAKPRLVVAYDRWLTVTSLDDAGNLLLSGSASHIADIERRLDGYATAITGGGARLVLVHLLPVAQPADCANPQYAGTTPCEAHASDDTLTPKYNAVMDRVAARHVSTVFTLDLQDVVCPADHCPPVLDGILIRSDALHFSSAGALWLVPYLDRRLPDPNVG
jgi:peptidoglycan/LPS O-acetylase OafA/YrhL